MERHPIPYSLPRGFVLGFTCFMLVLLVLGPSLPGVTMASEQAEDGITVPLPESDVTVQVEADGSCTFTGTDIQYIGQVGEPSIACKSVTVLLPPSADVTTVKATIIGYQWTAVAAECDIQPVPPLVVGDEENGSAIGSADRYIIDGRDVDIYGTDALFPLKPVVKVDVQVMRQWKMAQVLYATFAYNPIERKIFQLSGNAIDITYERTSGDSGLSGADLTGADSVRGMAVNFAEMAGEYGDYAASASPGRYVIITTSAIKAASVNLADFVASKETRGFAVQVVTDELWGGGTGDIAAENIRSWLQANYQSLNIHYVLLVGNPDPAGGDVPMKMCYPFGEENPGYYYGIPTDFYYAELTSNWNEDGDAYYGEDDNDFFYDPPRAAEVAVGRIPYYGDRSDLDHILSKIVAYENAPAGTISWRENALLAMKPMDSMTPCYDLGEEIKNDILVPCSWTYHRVYDESYGLSPAPETSPCTVTNVTNAWYGSEFGAVFWWTHGSGTSASYIMDSTNAAMLDDAHPGFTFQASCWNGMPEDSNNLGYCLLKNGCIATVSASRESQAAGQQTPYAGTATNSGMTFEYAKRLIAEKMYAGDALNDLRLDVLTGGGPPWSNYLTFNLYGCPAVGPYTSGPSQAAPAVATAYADSVTADSALLKGNLSSLGAASSAQVFFDWGLTTSYGNATAPQTMTGTGDFSSALSRLAPATTYHFRARAVGDGADFGDDLTFVTEAASPAVTSSAVSDVSTTSATLNGNLSNLGSPSPIQVSFEWGLTTSYGNTTTPEAMAATGKFSASLTTLTAGTTYHFRAKAVGYGTAYGGDLTFTTSAAPAAPPTVTTNAATRTGMDIATLNGAVASLGSATSVQVSFEWGLTAAYGNTTPPAAMAGTSNFSADLRGLAGNTAYHFRAKAVGDDTAYGSDMTFTTSATPTTPPAVATGDADGVTGNSARLNGSLTSMGTTSSVTVSFLWGITQGGPYPNETAGATQTGSGAFYFNLTGLASETTYYCQARAVGDGTSYGAERSFTTTGGAPVIGSLMAYNGRPGDDLTVTITGTNLSGATAVAFGDGITVSEFRVASDTEITVRIAIGTEAESGKRDVTVTTPRGAVTAPGGFEVSGTGSRVHLWVYIVAVTGGLVGLGVLASLGVWLKRRLAKPTP